MSDAKLFVEIDGHWEDYTIKGFPDFDAPVEIRITDCEVRDFADLRIPADLIERYNEEYEACDQLGEAEMFLAHAGLYDKYRDLTKNQEVENGQ